MGGKGGGSQTATQVNTPWGPTGQALQFGYNEAKDLYGYPQYPGNYYTTFNPIQEQALGLTQARSLYGSPTTSLAQAEAAQTLGGGYLDPRSNPYLQSAVGGALQDVGRAYAESVAPQLQSEFVGAGRYGSGLQQAAESLSRQDLARQMGNIASNMYGQAYESERDRMLKQAAIAPQFQTMDYRDLQALSSVGDVVDQKAREILESDLRRYLYPQTQLDQYVNRIGGLGGQQFGTQAKTTPTQGSSLLGDVLGVANTAAGLFTAFSDQSLKKDIELIKGKKLGPAQAYKYRYVWEPDSSEKHVGVMAQELQEIMPDAVMRHPSGYLMVDYAKIL